MKRSVITLQLRRNACSAFSTGLSGPAYPRIETLILLLSCIVLAGASLYFPLSVSLCRFPCVVHRQCPTQLCSYSRRGPASRRQVVRHVPSRSASRRHACPRRVGPSRPVASAGSALSEAGVSESARSSTAAR